MVHYRRETERQRACFACHEELVWLRAMQLEAIIEPITFCLVLSFLHSLIFPLSLSLSPCCSLHLLLLGLILITQTCLFVQPRPCFTVNPSHLPIKSCNSVLLQNPSKSRLSPHLFQPSHPRSYSTCQPLGLIPLHHTRLWNPVCPPRTVFKPL